MHKLVLTFLLIILFAGCQKQQNLIPKPLRLNLTNQISTLDPRKSADPYSSAIIFMLYEGLTRYNNASAIEPALASAITVSEDQKTYTFKLKESYWSNHCRVTAYDFELTWKEILDPTFPSPNAPLLYCIKNAKAAKTGQSPLNNVGITALDATTLVIELEHPTPYFLELISFYTFFPVYHKDDRVASNAIDKDWNKLISNGPFQIDYYHYQSELALSAKNAKIDNIVISFISDEMTALEMFNQGDLDFIGLWFSPIPHDAIAYLKKQNQVKQALMPSTFFCSYNLGKAPFDDLALRKAIDLSINKEALVDAVAFGFGSTATGLIPPMQKKVETPTNYALSSLPTYLPQKIVLLCVANRESIKIAEIIGENITSTLAIPVQIEALEMKYYLEKLYKRDYQMAICEAISQYNEPSSLLLRFENKDNPKNYPMWANNAFADLMRKALTSPSSDERFAFYLKAEEKIKEETPISPLYHRNEPYLENPKLEGVFISPIGSIHFDRATLHTQKSAGLRLNFIQEPTTFDNIKASDYVSTSLQFFIGEGLTRMLPREPVAMGIADSVEISNDRKTYTFHIRKAKWSDGSIITAFDFERGWKRALNPAELCSNSLLFFSILGAKEAKLEGKGLDKIGVKALNSSTLQVTLEYPTEHFLQITSFCTLFPVHPSPPLSYKQVISSGPYYIADYKPGHQLVLKKNPYYWDEKNVTCPTIHISLIKDPLTAFELFKQNELDLIGAPFTPVPVEVAKTSAQFQATASTTMLCFNLTHPLFANLNLRKAFCAAIDQNELANHMEQQPATGLIPPPFKNYTKACCLENPSYYLRIALEELGISKEDLTYIKLSYSPTHFNAKSAEVIEAQIFKSIGIHIRLEPLDQKIFVDHLFRRDFDFSLCTILGQYFDPMNFLERFSNKGGVRNYPNFECKKYNQLIEKITKETLPNERNNYIREAEALIEEEAPLFPLYYNSTAYITNPSLKNVEVNPTGGLFLNRASY